MNSAVKVPYHLCFETLANKLRIDIIKALEEKPMSVLELAEKLDAEQSRVSHSLERLKKCNYIDFEVKGKQRIYFLQKHTLEDAKAAKTNEPYLMSVVEKHVAKCCSKECIKNFRGTKK